MTSPQAEAYAQEQKAAVLAAIAVAGTAAGLAGFQLANFTVFMRWLRMLFPIVVRGRDRAAWSARNFFDLERARVTGLPRLDVPLLPDYEFDWFVNDMRPAYNLAVKQIRQVRELERQGVAVPAPKVESTVRVAVAKIVADAGREQMIGAVTADAEQAKNLRETKKEAKRLRKTWGDQWVEDNTPIVDLDTQSPDVVGWARVQTGDETCAWCLMLCSRGPVYLTAQSAGASEDVDDPEAVFGTGAAIPMDEWHTGCDCTVMPVYDINDWPGKAAADEALEAWKTASEDFVYDPDKKYRFGVQQKDGSWKFRSSKVTEGAAKYRETLNNLRFTLEGRDPSERQRVSKDQLDEILRAVPGAAKLFANSR